MKKFFIRIDMFLNYALGGNKNETISSRLGRKIERDGCLPCKLFCRIFLLPLGIIFNKNAFRHCRESIQEEHRNG